MDWVSGLDIWTDPELHADPYPRYGKLREACPAARSEALGGYWLFSRYEDVLSILQDAGSFSNEVLFVPPIKDPTGRRIPIELDPPEHGQYKKLLARYFSPQRVRALEPATREVARELLAPTRGRPSMEFMAEFAVPLPFRVMMKVFGLPAGDFALLKSWDDAGLREGTSDLALRREATKAARVRLLAYFRELLADRARDTSGEPAGLVDELVRAAHPAGRPLELDELTNICVTLWNASLHTTANVLGNSVVHLSDRPDLRDRLTAEPELIADALEELMRYESIVAQARLVVADTEIAGQPLHKGEFVVTLTGSAGRDERQFDRPDEIDFDRPAKPHLMFGAGVHRCIGSHVARMELRVALEELHRTHPGYRRDPARPPHRHTGLERGTTELHLLLS
ncbi:cytochrome P450 [Streptomyces sp. MNU77]|nr:cytochrome P450 [Streptomyces sp. MNU77]